MARSLSDYGLTDKAKKWLKKNGAKEIGSYTEEDVFYFQGMTYYIYKMPDRTVVEEYEQASIWDAGPNIYRAIRNAETKEPIMETVWDLNVIEMNHSYDEDTYD